MRNSVGKRLRCLVQECYGDLKIVCDVFGGLAGTDAGARRLNGHSVAHEEGTAESNVRIDFEEIATTWASASPTKGKRGSPRLPLVAVMMGPALTAERPGG